MSKRVISIKRDYVGVGQLGEPALRGTEFVPDPDAPSVSEVVEILIECRNDPPKDYAWTDWEDRIDNLISRLEE